MFRASGLRRTGLPGFGLAVEGFWGCERLRVLVEGLGGLGAFGKGFGDVGMVSGLGALHKLFRASARGFGFPVHGVAVHKDTVAWHGMVWNGLCGLGWPGWEDLRQPAKALLAGQGQKSSGGFFASGIRDTPLTDAVLVEVWRCARSAWPGVLLMAVAHNFQTATVAI